MVSTYNCEIQTLHSKAKGKLKRNMRLLKVVRLWFRCVRVYVNTRFLVNNIDYNLHEEGIFKTT